MVGLTTWLLAASIALSPTAGSGSSRRIDVDCTSAHSLQGILDKAGRQGEVNIYLHGVCEGNFVIAADGVTLRGATPESGLAGLAEGLSGGSVLEVIDAQVSLSGLVVQGAGSGVEVRGWNSDVFLYEVSVQVQGIGVHSNRGGSARIIDSDVSGGSIGIYVDNNAYANLQNTHVSNQRTGIAVWEGSFAAINNSTIENCQEVGLDVRSRSDANVLGGAFLENGQGHIGAGDWSSVSLTFGVQIGSATDATPFAMSAIKGARIASYSTPDIYGDVGALTGGSIAVGNTVIHGDLSVRQFANAHVRDAEITGVVFCSDGAEAICRQTTTGGMIDCPSSTCGAPLPAATARTPAFFEIPDVDSPLPRRRPGLR